MRNQLLKSTMALGLNVLAAAPAIGQPNVLLVLADDMGVDASPCHAQGSSMVRMPTLANLCANGMVFDNAHVAPTCSPTRAMVMTGEYSSNNGVGAVAGRATALSSDSFSLFDAFDSRASRYSAGLVGKWHLGERRDLDHPASLGVQDFKGPLSGGVEDYENWRKVENGRTTTTKTYATSEIANDAIDWIGKNANDPWFMWVAFNAPHDPFHAPPSDLHSFGKLPAVTGRGQDVQKHYFAALEALDSELSRVLGSVADPENTVVIFMGDNGTPRQVGRRIGTVNGSKGSLMDGGTHVPLVISGPGIATGRTNAPVMATDLFATILDLAGLNSKIPDDSISMVPLLDQTSQKTRDAILIEIFGGQSRRNGPTEGWKIQTASHALIAYEGEEKQLFDMVKDPKQTRNLLANPASVQMRNIAQDLEKQRRQMLE